MNIELQREQISVSETLCRKISETTLDTDIIVPDSKPDAEKVLQVDAVSFVGEIYPQKNYVTVSGTVSYKILYLCNEAEAEVRLRSICCDVPFSQQVEVSGIDDTAVVTADSDVTQVTFGIINSRKINVQTVMDIEISAVRNSEVEFLSGISGDIALPSKSNHLRISQLVAMGEAEFTAGDALSVPAGNPLPAEILKVDAKIEAEEIKPVNDKVVAKGNVTVSTLYIGENDQVLSMEHNIGFTEVLDLEGVDPDGLTDVQFKLKDTEYRMASDRDGDLSILDFQARIGAQIKCYRQETIHTLTDLYSPDYEMELTYRTVSLERITNDSVGQCIIKDDISIPQSAPSMVKIYHVTAKPYIEQVSLTDHRIRISGIVETHLLYLSESVDSPVYSCKKEIPFTHFMEAPDSGNDGVPAVKVNVEHLNYSFASANDTQIRMVLSVSARVTESETASIITDIAADDQKPIDKASQASIVVYFVQSGDTAWNIAKRYHTTVEEIASANRIALDELHPGMRLIIPKHSVAAI